MKIYNINNKIMKNNKMIIKRYDKFIDLFTSKYAVTEEHFSNVLSDSTNISHFLFFSLNFLF